MQERAIAHGVLTKPGTRFQRANAANASRAQEAFARVESASATVDAAPLLIDLERIARAPTVAKLSIVIPTFNERDNVEQLLDLIETALPHVEWEVVFVDDDSSDGTGDVVMRICRVDPRVRLIRRLGRRGLSSAVVEGILSTSAPFVAVLDADLQHDERLLGPMLQTLDHEKTDLVVGSRYMREGDLGSWAESRQAISQIATTLSRMVLKVPMTDPMSGFFMVRREAFDRAVRNLSNQGYKILLDLVASSPTPPRVMELPYVFRVRQRGESKLDALVTLEYVNLLLDKLVGRWIPVKFILFAAIGGLGVLVHMATLSTLMLADFTTFLWAQTSATIAAMTFNFFVNNVLTYRDKQLKGLRSLTIGLLSFYVVCSVGAVANVGIAQVMFTRDYSWWLAGIAGILVGAVWNYALSSIFTWKTK
jgi:dolichol-phosphate mannosyltransferase